MISRVLTACFLAFTFAHGYVPNVVVEPYWLKSRQFENYVPRGLIVGCGKGKSIQRMREHYPHHQLVGIDKDAVKINQARNNHPDMVFIEDDARSTLFHPNIFNIIKVEFSISNIKNKKPLLQQLHRILQDGGKLFMKDYNDDHPYMREIAMLSDSQKKYVAPNLFEHHSIIRQLQFRNECVVSKDGFTYFSYEKI